MKTVSIIINYLSIKPCVFEVKFLYQELNQLKVLVSNVKTNVTTVKLIQNSALNRCTELWNFSADFF